MLQENTPMRRNKKKPTINQFIMEKFLKNPDAIWKEKNSRMRELGTTKKLLNKYPNKKFWFRMPLPFPMDSLLWFLTKDGLDYLRKEHLKYKLDLPPKLSYSLSSAKIGETKKIAKKQNLWNFLKDDKKEG